MGRNLLCLLLGVGLTASHAFAQATTDADVARGIRQIEDGDIDSGIVTLDLAARRLAADPGKTRDLTQAYLYLGIGYVAKGQEALAKARFRAAVTQSRELTLSRDQYPPKVVELFEAAKLEQMAGAPSPRPAVASPQPGGDSAKKGRSKTPLILAGVAVAGGAGVLAASGGGGGNGGATTAPNYRVDHSDTRTLSAHGGGNGSTPLSCQGGQLMMGLVGTFDFAVVLRLSGICAVLLPDASLSGEISTATIGTAAGNNPTPINARCPAGQAIVSISGFEGDAPINVRAIQSLSFTCASVREWVAGGALGQAFGPYGPNSGGRATARFDDPCPVGYFVTSMLSGTGSAPPPSQSVLIVEKLQATCTRVQR